MPTDTGRAFTTANFLFNLAALKAINFGSADPAGVWFVVPNQVTNNIEIWVWEPSSVAVANDVSVVHPNSVAPTSAGRCIQSLKIDPSSLGGILAAIVALSTAGLIERTNVGGVNSVTISAFAKTLIDDANATEARTTLGLGAAAVRSIGTVTGAIRDAADTAYSNARTPTAHASTHAVGGTDPLTNYLAGTLPANSLLGTGASAGIAGPIPRNTFSTPAEVNAAIASLVNSSPVVLDTLGELAAALGNNPNFATTITTALALKAPLASPTFTGTVAGITAAMVGLGNLNNTSDASKPISTAQQTALNLKANLNSPVFTGIVSLAGQLKFPAIQESSADVNTLDDYKEGTFIPVLSGTTTAGAGTYTNQTGNYTKIGNRIIFDLILTWSVHTGTGNLTITGLPFSSNAGTWSPCKVYNNGLIIASGNVLQAVINQGSGIILLAQYTPSTGLAIAVPVDTAGQLIISGCYRTT